MSIWDWLSGDGSQYQKKVEAWKPPLRAESATPSENFGPKKRAPYPTAEEDLSASYKATVELRKRRAEAYKAYEPKGPPLKIVQADAGHYEIQRRRVVSYQDGYYFDVYHVQWADEIEKRPVGAYEVYESIRNTDAPIMTRTTSYGRYGSDSESLTGYAPLAFNIFADAEAYLKRMVRAPAEKEVGYDFPPLKKRATKMEQPK